MRLFLSSYNGHPACQILLSTVLSRFQIGCVACVWTDSGDKDSCCLFNGAPLGINGNNSSHIRYLTIEFSLFVINGTCISFYCYITNDSKTAA